MWIGLGSCTRCRWTKRCLCRGEYRVQGWSTQIVDVRSGQLLGIVSGRDSVEPTRWFMDRPQWWRDRVGWAVMDMSGPYKAVFDTALPDAGQVADPFHVVKLANGCVDECRRRVQHETLGHRGRKDDPLFRCRKLLVKAEERVTIDGRAKVQGLLRAGDPKGEATYAWHMLLCQAAASGCLVSWTSRRRSRSALSRFMTSSEIRRLRARIAQRLLALRISPIESNRRTADLPVLMASGWQRHQPKQAGSRGLESRNLNGFQRDTPRIIPVAEGSSPRPNRHRLRGTATPPTNPPETASNPRSRTIHRRVPLHHLPRTRPPRPTRPSPHRKMRRRRLRRRRTRRRMVAKGGEGLSANPGFFTVAAIANALDAHHLREWRDLERHGGAK